MTRILPLTPALALVLAVPAHAAAPALPYGSTIGNEVTAPTVAQGTVGRDDLGGSLMSDDSVTADTVTETTTTDDTPAPPRHGRRAVAPPGSDAGGWAGSGDADTVFAQTYNHGKRLTIKPYIEAAQIVDATLTAPSDVLTYSMVAAGVEMKVNGRNNQGVVALRYERRFDENHHANGIGSESGDTISGVAHGSSAIVPGTLRIDAGGFATRTGVNGSGAVLSGTARSNNSTQIYAGYIGPALTTHVGAVAVDGHYRVGYDSVNNPGTAVNGTTVTSTGATATVPNMIAQTSFVQDAHLAASTRPGDALPVGLGAEGGYFSEHINVLDQKLRDAHAEGKVLIPIGDTVQVVGGVGYEDVKVTNRDALRDASGNPVRAGNGQYVTNMASAQAIAFDTTGLIWDVGVVWRPGPRTYVEGHVGRRYGTIGGWGEASYQATARLSFSAQVYNAMTGFGGGIESALTSMPAQFNVVRDPITGNVTGCIGPRGAANCIGGGLTTVTAAVHRTRGFNVNAIYDTGPVQLGLSAGYNRNVYVGAPGTALAFIDGDYDATWWTAAYLSGQIDRQTFYQLTLQAYRYRTDLEANGDVTGGHLTASLSHNFSHSLTGTASLSIDEISQQALVDEWGAGGALGLRYSF